MKKASNFAAYTVWIVAVVAILMPPSLASAGITTLNKTKDKIFELVEINPKQVTVPDLRSGKRGWTA
jgi:hypothetical protein